MSLVSRDTVTQFKLRLLWLDDERVLLLSHDYLLISVRPKYVPASQGDARACFPPDLGQGVNSALEDVDELAQVGYHFFGVHMCTDKLCEICTGVWL